MKNIVELNVNNERLLEMQSNNSIRSIPVATDVGYEPIVTYKDILINKFGFNLEQGFGVTDIIYVFNDNKSKYSLRFDSEMDMVVFEIESTVEEEIEKFRSIASYLHGINLNEKDNEENYARHM